MKLFPRDELPAYLPAITAPVLRPHAHRKVNRLRVSWFVLGALCGAVVGLGAGKMGQTHETAAIPAGVIDAVETPASASMPVASTPAVETPPVTETQPPVAADSAAITANTAEESAPPFETETADAAAQQTSVAAEAPEEPPVSAITLPATFTIKVEKKQTLASIFMDNGVPEEEASEAVDALKKFINPKRITAGQVFTLKLDNHPSIRGATIITGLEIEASALRSVTLSRNAKGKLIASEVKAKVNKSLARGGGKIRSSLYQTAIDAGIPVKMVGEIIQAFSYDVDFQRDVKQGDRLDVVYERMHTDKNVTAGTGKMMYASLTLGGKELTIYRHTSSDGFTGYYNARGESVRKALLRTPINGAHITSGFGMRRHPLLGYSKMHKGMDFGAPTGTPIYAAGDGVIEEAGRKGGYGNYVRIRHNKSYATAYGHASRIAKGIRPGMRVRQGQIIAYVGSTGASTGPHLHYEVIAGNTQVNPAGVKFRTGQQLAGKEFLAFKKNVKQVESLIASTGGSKKTQVASVR